MKFDGVYSGPPAGIGDAATAAKNCGFDCLWTPETAHDPFLSLLLAHQREPSLEIGTAIAVGLARSPMTLAQSAWDLTELTRGKFMLGLGSQVKAHITRRFSMPWHTPIDQTRELIGALRAIWDSFRGEGPLRFQGQYYKLSLLTPFFTPPPQTHSYVPVGLAAVGPKMTQLAGEVADFAVLHPFTHSEYLRQVTMPALQKGLALRPEPSLNSSMEPRCLMVGSTFTVTGEGQQAARAEEQVRRQVAFYGSTPAYAPVLEVLGMEGLGLELHKLSREGKWDEMARKLSDEVLQHFCVYAPSKKLFQAIEDRFGGYYDRVMLNLPPQELAELL